MELKPVEFIPGHFRHEGVEWAKLAAGERLQIRKGTPGDVETILDEEVPEGVEWLAHIIIEAWENG